MLKTYVFSSPIEGVLLQGGKPLANIEVVRELSGDGVSEAGERDIAASNEKGEFSFPIIQKKSLFEPGFSFATKFVYIETTVKLSGNVYNLFTLKKENYKPGGEGRGNPIRLVCDIDDFEIFRGQRLVKCEFLDSSTNSQ